MAAPNPAPNLIERMENLLYALDEASEELLNSANALNHYQQASLDRISDAAGIGKEVLTMIDVR